VTDSVQPVTTGRTDDGRLTLVFFRARANINYTVQWSEDLATWHNLVFNPGVSGESVQVTDTASGSPRRFLRLIVTQP
jgi:hypothetical protein